MQASQIRSKVLHIPYTQGCTKVAPCSLYLACKPFPHDISSFIHHRRAKKTLLPDEAAAHAGWGAGVRGAAGAASPGWETGLLGRSARAPGWARRPGAATAAESRLARSPASDG